MDELEGCFDSLATAAVTGKDTLDVLIKTSAELSAIIKTQAEEIKSLAASISSLKNKKGGDGGGNGRPKTKEWTKREQKYCPHCKRDTWHDPDDCFELAKNAIKRRATLKSVFDTS